MRGGHRGPKEPKWLYRDLKRMHERATAVVFAERGLNIGQPLLLFVLEDKCSHGVNPTQRDLADELNLSPTTITVSLKSLERNGCIRKFADEEDMRKNRIKITPKGREMAKNCRNAIDKVDEGMYYGFSSEEIALISSFFIRMTENLKRLTERETQAQEEVTN